MEEELFSGGLTAGILEDEVHRDGEQNYVPHLQNFLIQILIKLSFILTFSLS